MADYFNIMYPYAVMLLIQGDQYYNNEYQEILGKIQAINDSFESTNIFIIGDFNADIKKPSRFTPFLNGFINDCHLIPGDTLLLSSVAFTYVSDAHGSRSWLDHVLTTYSSHSSISDMTVSLLTKLLPSSEAPRPPPPPPPPPYRSKFNHLVLCGMLPPQDLHKYHTQTGLLLSAIHVQTGTLIYSLRL